jgi:hypothetical protein
VEKLNKNLTSSSSSSSQKIKIKIKKEITMIRKIKGRYYVVHHRTKGLIGKPIKSSPKGGFKTYKQALRQHKAIMAMRYKRKR